MIGVAVLGSTGSIGRSTLEVLRRQRDHFRVVALTCGRNREEFAAQVAEWRPAYAGLALPGQDERWPCGPDVLVEAATHPDVGIVVNAVVGAAGLDVYAKEPCTDSPLFELDTVVATPHLGASTSEAQERAGVDC